MWRTTRGLGYQNGFLQNDIALSTFHAVPLASSYLHLCVAVHRSMELTKEGLKKMCRDSGLYSSPALNDKLYLHYKVRTKISYIFFRARVSEYLSQDRSAVYLVETITCMCTLGPPFPVVVKSMNAVTLLYVDPKVLLSGQGIRQIQNLEEYTGLRVLWLEGNGLSRLEGMEAQTEMKTLYAQENLIEKIEGLDSFLLVSELTCRQPSL